ncbi:5-oxoprolinase subunit PxpB [Bordetella bronchialis]|uniref:Allophanate hydrolase n=1 Tax=Bordetella bronchialis TaxID=463025 RepID=A0A193G1X9_9BORD|nr:5-oxoprolinase subunit PxpB [Bordetella bronchialis]ANN68864.1 allophanate hydrolase [Bordetella bronchialis]ANN74012.1 allophanate hydrolase [Bordetella bronchialis]
MDAAPDRPAPAWRIHPQGDRCLLVVFGDAIDEAVGRRCLAVSRLLRDAALPGVTDVVPSFVAVAVHYAPGPDGRGPTYAALAEHIHGLLAQGIPDGDSAARDVTVPVCYGGEHGPDLEDVARAAGISPEEVIALHTRPGSMVYMLGFAPGHPYIGVHDARLNLPRRASPRTAVPMGSVAVANRQTVIYPSRLPGGWNIIGATPLRLFDPAREPASLLQPGDRIRFVPIDAQAYARMRAEQE